MEANWINIHSHEMPCLRFRENSPFAAQGIERRFVAPADFDGAIQVPRLWIALRDI
jgi:hypothetical protein